MPSPGSPVPSSGIDGKRTLVLLAVGGIVLLAGCAAEQSTTEEAETNRSSATVAFDFDGSRDADPQRIEETVRYDPTTRPSEDAYEDVNASRPDGYTLHDLLADTQRDTELDSEVSQQPGLGFQVTAVEGFPEEGSAQAWALYVDGERETAALNTVTAEDGATYEWRLQNTTGEAGDDRGQRQASDPSDGDGSSSEDGERTTRERSSSGSSTTPEATIVVEYNGFREEDPQRTEHRVEYDPETRPTRPLYEDAGTDRPDDYVLHDLVSDWSNQTGTDHIAREDGNDGFRLKTVGGVTAHSTQGGSWRWTLAVDGEAENTSLNGVRVEPGTTYVWSFERVSRGDGQ